MHQAYLYEATSSGSGLSRKEVKRRKLFSPGSLVVEVAWVEEGCFREVVRTQAWRGAGRVSSDAAVRLAHFTDTNLQIQICILSTSPAKVAGTYFSAYHFETPRKPSYTARH